jgi:hypothetical protein
VTTAIEELFHNLANEMARLREDPQRYRQFLQRCLREAHEAIQGTLVVRADLKTPRSSRSFSAIPLTSWESPSGPSED